MVINVLVQEADGVVVVKQPSPQQTQPRGAKYSH